MNWLASCCAVVNELVVTVVPGVCARVTWFIELLVMVGAIVTVCVVNICNRQIMRKINDYRRKKFRTFIGLLHRLVVLRISILPLIH